jgi:tetratricopeptide (TPR) repeat protein
MISGDPKGGVSGLGSQIFGEVFKDDFATSWQTCGTCAAPYCSPCAKTLRDSTCGKCPGNVSTEYNYGPGDIDADGDSIQIRYKGPLGEAMRMFEAGGRSMAMGDYRGAKSTFKEALGTYPDCFEYKAGIGGRIHFQLGYALVELEEFDEAIDELRWAIRLDPESSGSHLSLGNAYYFRGRTDEAMKAWRRTAELDPDNIDAHNNMGLILANSGKMEQALEEYERVLEIDPNYSNVHLNMGLAYREMGKKRKAKRHLKRFIALEESTGNPKVNQARSLLASL